MLCRTTVADEEEGMSRTATHVSSQEVSIPRTVKSRLSRRWRGAKSFGMHRWRGRNITLTGGKGEKGIVHVIYLPVSYIPLLKTSALSPV